jgi:hypothetical protein
MLLQRAYVLILLVHQGLQLLDDPAVLARFLRMPLYDARNTLSF